MSGVTVLASSYRRAPSTSDARGVCKALRACLLPGFPRLRKNDRRTYGEVIGIIWLQTSCQPVGDRYIAVNPNFHVRIHFNGIQLAAPRWARRSGHVR